MLDVQMLIKPAGGACNMRCSYCFYADEMKRREGNAAAFMDEETADAVITRAFETARRSVTFAFQGGEPTLVGLSFYERFVRRVREMNARRIPVHYALQTNGVLVDETWAAFFAKNKFLIGLSLDGPKEINDRYRKCANGRSTHAQTMRAAQLMQAAGVEFNVLCVVTGESARSMQRIYQFYAKHGFSFQQYIPCLNSLGEAGAVHSFSLSAQQYAHALRTLFDAYWADMARGKYVYIRQFENYVGLLRGHAPESCAMRGHCSIQLVVEADGSVYPCDFYALDEWRLGNVREQPLEALMQNERAQAFLARGEEMDAACRDCRYYALCRGGCRRERGNGLGDATRNIYCEAYRAFFDYALQRLSRL